MCYSSCVCVHLAFEREKMPPPTSQEIDIDESSSSSLPVTPERGRSRIRRSRSGPSRTTQQLRSRSAVRRQGSSVVNEGASGSRDHHLDEDVDLLVSGRSEDADDDVPIRASQDLRQQDHAASGQGNGGASPVPPFQPLESQQQVLGDGNCVPPFQIPPLHHATPGTNFAVSI